MTLPGHGESVGEAYIRIYADGSGLPESIKRSFRESDPTVKAEGRRHGEFYTKAMQDELRAKPIRPPNTATKEAKEAYRKDVAEWRKEYRKASRTLAQAAEAEFRKVTQKNLNRSLADALLEGATADRFINSAKWKKTKARIASQYREAGELAAKKFEQELGEGGNIHLLNRRLKDIRRHVARAAKLIRDDQERHEKKMNRIHARAIGENIRKDKDYIKALERLHGQAIQEDERRERFLALNRERRIKTVLALESQLNRVILRRRAIEERGGGEHFAHRMGLGREEERDQLVQTTRLAVESGDGVAELERFQARLNEINDETVAIDRGFKRVDRRVRHGVRDVGDFERSLHLVEDRVKRIHIGRMFGEGSRNDFLHFLGKVVGRMSEFVILAGVRAVRGLASWASAFRTARRDGDGLTFVINSLMRSVGLMVKSLATGGLALLAFQAILGPIAAAISMLAGVITALASSIIVGLVAAIGAALPLMGAMLVSFGVIGLAFARGGRTAKEWKEDLTKALGPVTSQFHKLQDAARAGLFPEINRAAPKLAGVLKQLNPLIKGVGESVGKAFNNFLDALKGDAFDKNLKSMETFFNGVGKQEGAIEKLGHIFTNTFGSIAGLMRALVPTANKFLDSLTQSSKKWSDFINSARGQNSIKKWFDQAWESGKTLYGFVRSLVRVVKDLVTIGAPTGDSIFTSWTDGLDRFDKFLKSDKGRASVRKWLTDSEKFLGHLGNFFGGVYRLFTTLAGGGQGPLNTILDVLGRIADIIADSLPAIQKFQREFFGALGEVADALFDALEPLRPLLKEMVEFLADIGGDAAQIAADVLVQVLHGLAAVTRFIARHENVFGPITKALLGFWAAWKGWTIIKAAALGIRSALPAFLGGARGAVAGVPPPPRTGLGAWAGTPAPAPAARPTGGFIARNRLLAGTAGAGLALAGSQTGGTGGALMQIGGAAALGATIGSFIPGIGTGVGAAVGAITGALTRMWGDANREAEAAKRKHEEVVAVILAASQRLRDALIADGNNIGRLSKGALALELQAPQPGRKAAPLDAAERLGLNTKTFVNAAAGDSSALAAFDRQMATVETRLAARRERIERLFGAQIKAGVPHDQIPGLAALEKAERQFENVREALERMQKALRKSIRGQDQLAASTTGLELGTRNAKTQILAYGRALDGNGIAAKRNREFITDHLDVLSKQAALMLASGKSADEAGRAYERNKIQLRKQLIEAGYAAEEVDKLIGKYRKVPPDVKTVLKQLGVKPADIQKIIDKYQKLPKDKTTVIHVDSEQVAVANQRLLDLAETFKGLPNALRIADANDDQVSGARGLVMMAAGGVLSRATMVRPWIKGGEAGLEALVPLRRPLSQVDPSVRALSAFAQGIALNGQQATQYAAGGGSNPLRQKIINIQEGAISVVTSSTDPVAVAHETVDRIATGGYD